MLDRYLPKDLIRRKNESELYIEFDNGSILKILGADKPESIKGMDFEGVGIDEWALVKREIWEETLRPIISQSATRWAMFAFTPKGTNHAKEYWNNSNSWREWHKTLLKASESNLLPEEELKQARIEMTDALYEQELECSFVAREEKSLITSEMLEALSSVELYETEMIKLIACDPACGGDECVINVFENSNITEQLILHEENTMIISGYIQNLGYKYGTKNYAGDSIGIGKGIVDDLRLKGWNVREINSAEKAFEETRFYNKRTEIWWYAAEKIRQKEVYPIKDEETKRQLVAPKYEVIDSNGKIRVEPKKYTKDILGRSPDRGDCYVYGIWGLQFFDSDNINENKRKVYAPQKYTYRPSVYGRRLAHAI